MAAGTDGQGGYTIARFNSDGTLDTTFGNNGIASISTGVWDSTLSKLLVQPDGDIVLVGIAGYGYDLELARFLPNGQVDTSFGSQQGYTTWSPGDYIGSCDALVQTGNQIVVAMGLPYADATDVSAIHVRGPVGRFG